MDHVHVWRAKNPINDLVYGYGGIKLFPRLLTKNMDTTKPDMTTSISKHFIAINEVANTTRFNTSPFETWKGAFRECAKLSSKIIDRQKMTKQNKDLKHGVPLEKIDFTVPMLLPVLGLVVSLAFLIAMILS